MRITLTIILAPFAIALMLLACVLIPCGYACGMAWELAGRMTKRKAVVAALFVLAFSVSAQEPIKRSDLDSTEVYTFVQHAGNYVHPKGYPVAVIIIKAEKSGTFYKVAMRSEYISRLSSGDIVEINPVP